MNKKIKSLQEFINESELNTHEIDPKEFPNPLVGKLKKFFKNKGKKDGNPHDDDVKTVPVEMPAGKLKPSQASIYLAHSLTMAVMGVEGGDLSAIISSDDYILDGHHRWAATMFNNPNAKVKGYQADLKIGDLIPVLRSLGDAFGNKRRSSPEGGDVSVFDATEADIRKAIDDGYKMDKTYYNIKDGKAWVEKKGGYAKVAETLKLFKKHMPPKSALPREKMPVIDDEKGELKKAAKLLNNGDIDVRKPYAKID